MSLDDNASNGATEAVDTEIYEADEVFGRRRPAIQRDSQKDQRDLFL